MDGYHPVRNGLIALLVAHHIHIRHPVRSSHPCFANHGVQGCRNGVVIYRRTNHHHGTHTKMGLHTKYIRLYPMCVAKLFPNSPIWNHRFLIRHNNHGIVHRMLRKPVDSHLPQRHEATTLCHIIRLERITLF